MRIAGILLVIIVFAGCARQRTEAPPAYTIVAPSESFEEVRVYAEPTLPSPPTLLRRTESENEDSNGQEVADQATLEAVFDIALYPGSYILHTIIPEEDEFGMISSFDAQASFSTKDSFEKVRDYYMERYPEAKVKADVDTPIMKVLEINWTDEGIEKTVIISRDQTEWTQILLHATPAKT